MINNELYDFIHDGELKKTADWLDARPDDLNEPIADGYAPLHVACMFGQELLVRHLLSRHVLVNQNATNDSRATALHLATCFRDDVIAEKIVQLLVECGAELNAAQAGGLTALHHAVARGSLRLVDALILAGADPFLKDELGRTAGELATGDDQELISALRASLKKAFSLPLEAR